MDKQKGNNMPSEWTKETVGFLVRYNPYNSERKAVEALKVMAEEHEDIKKAIEEFEAERKETR